MTTFRQFNLVLDSRALKGCGCDKILDFMGELFDSGIGILDPNRIADILDSENKKVGEAMIWRCIETEEGSMDKYAKESGRGIIDYEGLALM